MTSKKITSSKKNLTNLTVLRYFLAIIVVAHHFVTNSISSKLFEDGELGIRNTILNGYGAVTIFFVLSGFVINYSALTSQEPNLNIKKFYLKRFTKLYPNYLLALIICLVLLQPPIYPNLFLHIFMIQTFIPSHNIQEYQYNLPAWSLSCEFLFYLLFPILYRTLFKKASSLKALTILISAVFVLFIYSFIGESINQMKRYRIGFLDSSLDAIASNLNPKQLTFDWLAYTNPYSRILDFIIGMALASLYLELKKNKLATKKFLDAFSVLGVFILTINIINNASLSKSWYGRDFFFCLYAICVLWFLVAVIPDLGLTKSKIRKKFIQMLVVLGNSSYAIYIMHWAFSSKIISYLNSSDRDLTANILILSLIFMSATGVVVYRYFEDPIRRILLAKFDRQ